MAVHWQKLIEDSQARSILPLRLLRCLRPPSRAQECVLCEQSCMKHQCKLRFYLYDKHPCLEGGKNRTLASQAINGPIQGQGIASPTNVKFSLPSFCFGCLCRFRLLISPNPNPDTIKHPVCRAHLREVVPVIARRRTTYLCESWTASPHALLRP